MFPSNRWRPWLSTYDGPRVEVERAKGDGCLTLSALRRSGSDGWRSLSATARPAQSRDNGLVGRAVARVPVEEHMANCRAASRSWTRESPKQFASAAAAREGRREVP